MLRFILICLAGALGTGSRYLVGLGCMRAFGGDFPIGTLVVNVLGCFLIALVMQVATIGLISETTRYMLATGFMGGLTTYSAFNFESTQYFDQRAYSLMLLNVLLTLALCFAAGMAGAAVARRAFA